MDQKQLQKVFAAELGDRPYASRISKLLFETLMDCDGRTFKAVVAEMDWLEKMPWSSATRTKKQKKFSGDVLGNLRHTHYTTSEHLITNIELHWTSEDRASEVQGIKDLITAPENAGKSPEELWKLSGDIAGQLVGAYTQRRSERKLTGEWLIYGLWEEKNYFLDLGCHAELTDEQALFDRLYSGCPEFDFCFQ
ncbi:hypothetical protein ACDH60_21705 [Pseudomonas ficuserectae]|nr:hypothetical protein [Pseudomonas amygdali]KKY56537.1 hypothetical protein AAY85_19815 [Pseudomonas amygdali pv. lachrymans]RMP46939.1 hypothetical protein ALQ26_01030 [Pseudomonas amygdali pv. lachrymans]